MFKYNKINLMTLKESTRTAINFHVTSFEIFHTIDHCDYQHTVVHEFSLTL